MRQVNNNVSFDQTCEEYHRLSLVLHLKFFQRYCKMYFSSTSLFSEKSSIFSPIILKHLTSGELLKMVNFTHNRIFHSENR